MKVIILCGGKGTRLSEETKKIPKPMVKIGNYPILEHIINIFTKYGYKDFIFALGYKKEIIINYFKKKKFGKLNIKLINTGKKTLTGTRIKKLKKYLGNDENFFLTYGDGVSNINLNKLLKFHLKNNKIATVTAVRPPARFGEIFLKKNKVKKFDEKNQIRSGWINGGFFVFNKKILNYIPKKDCMLEKEPMVKLVKNKQLNAYKHYSFWQCMDTLRDKELLNKIWKSKKKKW
tara:strand:+ start:458 stop:1156 length:699 start_codon:yes stop_codon:yes gene_type:complete